ncbi:TetR family transcriptional regulator [Micromonospora sp. URMC 105]|uniref:TetR family transcriptional regulator n=1 Tax=Micromonospora sp. URMC 105 TaxID=3423413 RepID=UPI003F1DC89E
MTTTGPTGGAAPGRGARRESTRAAILHAAREAWSEHGYDDIGLRDIAGRAGVTAAMVNRYFGTKEGLFREAVGTRDPSPPGLHSISREEFGTTLAALLLGGGHEPVAHGDEGAYDPLLLVLRSAASHAAQPVLRDYVEQTVIPPLTTYFGDDDPAAKERAVLALSLLLGMDVLGRMLAVAPLDAGPPPSDQPPKPNARLAGVLSAMLQAAADAPGTAPWINGPASAE